MKFTVEIELGNDLAQTGKDIAEMLLRVAGRIQYDDLAPKSFANIKDLNGNTVGLWQVKETEDVV